MEVEYCYVMGLTLRPPLPRLLLDLRGRSGEDVVLIGDRGEASASL